MQKCVPPFIVLKGFQGDSLRHRALLLSGLQSSEFQVNVFYDMLLLSIISPFLETPELSYGGEM